MSIGAVPILARDPPPEGLQSANFAVTLTQLQPNYAASLQLNSQSGLSLSQVVSLYVDNQLNPVAITLVHGSLNEATIIPAGAAVVIPTMSNGGYYTFNVSVPGAQISPITGAVTFNIVLSNYMRHKATFSSVLSGNVAGIGNTISLFSGLVDAAIPGEHDLVSSIGSGFIIDSVDLAIEAIATINNGPFAFLVQLSEFFGSTAPNPLAIATIACEGSTSTAGQFINGSGLSKPCRRTFELGLLVLTQGLTLHTPITPILNNIQNALIRVNVSGVNLS